MKRIFKTGILLFIILGNLAAQEVLTPALSRIAYTEGEANWIYLRSGLDLDAETLMESQKAAFGLSDHESTRLLSQKYDEIGYRHDTYTLYHKGIEVEHSRWIVHSLSGSPVKANGFLPLPFPREIASKAQITSEQALDMALQHLNGSTFAWESEEMEEIIKKVKDNPQATYYPEPHLCYTDEDFDFSEYKPVLAWKMDILSVNPIKKMLVYVDAVSGKILKELNDLHTRSETGVAETAYRGEQIITTERVEIEGSDPVYRLREQNRNGGSDIWTLDLDNTTNLDNAKDFLDDDNIWDEFDNERSRAATDAHFMAQFTYDYFENTFQRKGFDGNGGLVLSYMHYGDSNFFNAFFAGSFMGFGDGGGKPLSTPDIFAHEFMHGVTRYSADLIYAYEPGALNESFSDIFGNSLEYYVDPSKFSWYLGEDTRIIIRNMADPNEFGDPKVYQGKYWWTEEGNNGGVHTNSGVQNYWFYLVVEGGQGQNELGRPIQVKGIGFEKALQIAYRALTVYLTPTSAYADARNASIQASIDIFGECSDAYQAVVNAWDAVGLGSPTLTNDFQLVSMTDLSDCNVFDEGPLTLTFQYTGCDTFPGGSLGLQAIVSDPSQSLSGQIEVGELQPRESFSYTFEEDVRLPELGSFSVEASISYTEDPAAYNNSLRNSFSKTTGLTGVESFPFNGGSDLNTLSDSFKISTGEQSEIKIVDGFGKDRSRGLIMEGGERFGYLLTFQADPFQINQDHLARVCMCVDGRRSARMDLYFDRKQDYSSYVEETFQVDPEAVPPLVNNLRLVVNGNEVSRYQPETLDSDPFQTEKINLDAYLGSIFEVCFEGMLHQSPALDDIGFGDRIYLDNLRFDGFVERPSTFQSPESGIDYWYYPNPTQGNLKVALETDQEEDYRLDIVETTGRLLKRYQLRTVEGINGINLDFSRLSPGIYFLRVSNGKEIEVSKIIRR